MKNNYIITKYNQFLKESYFKNDFTSWFDGSKIVDFQDNPLVCYHGTNNIFDNFDLSYIGKNTNNYGHYGYGIYLSTDIREAKTYGKHIYKCYVKMCNPFRGTNEEIKLLKDNGASNIDDLEIINIDYDSLINAFDEPYIKHFLELYRDNKKEDAWRYITDKNINFDMNDISDIIEYTSINNNRGVPEYIMDILNDYHIVDKVIFNKDFLHEQSLHWITDLGKNSKEVTDIIKKLGYDGVWYGSEIVVFDAEQIKIISKNF